MVSSSEPRAGRLIASALTGAWRGAPPAPTQSEEELARVAPLLAGSGAAALGWWRVRESPLRVSPAGFDLHDAYRLHALHAALREREIQQVFKLLRSAGVEPLLIKGWAIARLYPHTGLRPYGDIDLCVRPDQQAAAEAALQSPEGQRYWVDLRHGDTTDLYGQGFEEWHGRSSLVRLGEVDVRIPGPEDHLRILCLHLLKHGAWRPLWLCDIGAALESRPAEFDWDRLLSGGRRRANWVACTIGLAHRLLGARLEGTPVADRGARLPAWLLPSVLKQWESPCSVQHAPPELMTVSLRHPARVPRAIRRRWLNPIEATIDLRAPFNGLPRLPFQVGSLLYRTAQFLGRLLRLAQEQRPPADSQTSP